MNILFTGGYTLGSVTPLLAVAEELISLPSLRDGAPSLSDGRLCWIGTRQGPERKLVSSAGIKFFWLWAPKWRRYFDWRNIMAPLLLSYSVIWSLGLLLWTRPDVIVTAGGFVGVPVVWAGRILGIPALLHNQDAHWSLANRLIAPLVKRITYALPNTLPRRWESKAVWTGNPVRSFILNGDKEAGLKMCGFARMPTILVIGGGTGAQRLNEIVRNALPDLLKDYQVVHLVGRGKMDESGIRNQESGGYCCIEFAGKEMGDLYAVADLVITRAGMGTLTELSALGKCMIIVPLPNTHQEQNARYFKKHNAAVVLEQNNLTGDGLVSAVHQLFSKIGAMQEHCERNKEFTPSNAAEQVAGEILRLV